MYQWLLSKPSCFGLVSASWKMDWITSQLSKRLDIDIYYELLIIPSREVLAMLKHVDQLLIERFEYALESRPRRLIKRVVSPPILIKIIVIWGRLKHLLFVENDVVVHSSQKRHGVGTNLDREIHKGRRVDVQELWKSGHGGDGRLFVVEIFCSQNQDLGKWHILDKFVELRVVQAFDNQI